MNLDLRNDPWLKILAIDVDSILEVRVRLGSIVNIGVSCSSLCACELYRESTLLLMLELRLLQIKRNGPVVDIAVADVLLWTRVVTLSTKDAPVNVVEILANIALADLEVDTVGEIFDKVPVCPVDAVLFRLQRLGRVGLETVTIFTRGLVRSTNSPDFFASRFFPPMNVLLLSLTSLDFDFVLGILPKDVVSVDC